MKSDWALHRYVRRTLKAAVLIAGLGSQLVAGEVSFNRDVRPILSENCYQCHGPDAEERKADLRLDTEAGAKADLGGYHAVVSGDLSTSELVARILAEDHDELMPPPKSKKRLTSEQKETLQRWIEEGAKFEKHWAFEPVAKSVPPKVKDESWARNEIDHFILARQDAAGIAPSPQAPREVLIRRLYLDLIGLLPSPEEVHAFVHDKRPDAYDRLVTHLLSSVHHGERWGRHWLDQARYADSDGYTIDRPRTQWPYRDWVVRAINADMPFDQFTIEQLAGDLLPNPTHDQLLATGFHRNSLINGEGGTDNEQFRNEAVVDRVNTTGAVWLGLTVGCAQCHTHKFDPITHHEYFQMFAFFNSDEDVNNVGPNLLTPEPTSADVARLKEIDKEIKTLRAKSKGSSIAKNEQLKEEDWKIMRPVRSRAESGALLELQPDGSLLASGTLVKEDEYLLRIRIETDAVSSVRIEAIPDESLPSGGPGRAANGNFVLTEVEISKPDGTKYDWLDAGAADYSQPGHEVSRAIDGDPLTGWAINTKQKGNVARWAAFSLTEPVIADEQGAVDLRLKFWHKARPYTLGRFRVSMSEKPLPGGSPEDQKRQKQLKALLAEKDQIEGKGTKMMIMRELDEPRETHVHVRGDFLRKGDRVGPGTLEVLHEFETESGHPNRLDLAQWLVNHANPLTPRVVVNRVWQKYFGRGIVETENDFGTQGTPPTHPELLDWLARRFVEEGWSMKKLHRLIVSSATYRQASSARPDLQEIDPRNLLLARQERLRVEAEIVRDLALSASGKLTEKIGGPPVFPPQPDGVYAFTQRKKNWETSEGDDRFRRTIYTFFYRSAPHPMLTTFDTPRFNATCTQRIRSNTPLQSLMVANDAGLYELAQSLGTRVIQELPEGSNQVRLERMFQICLCRTPEHQELEFLMKFLEKQRQEADELNAWTATARVLMNLDEFITRE
ncbi:MAG: PSD1 and planctomycete cytochrome C domain-containing protein [Verrucomicrobiota bacterium]